MTTATPAKTTASRLEINELALTKADAITLSELLESELVADTVIRSICIIRKTLLSKDIVEPEDQQLEAKLTALYHALSFETRELAHQMQRQRLDQAAAAATAPQRPLPTPLPPVPAAGPKLELMPAITYANEVLKSWRALQIPRITNDELHAEIAKRRELPWHSTDLILLDSNTPRWHRTIALAMKKLAEDEQVMWSAKTNSWLILDA